MEETRKSLKTSELKAEVHSQKEAWKREAMAGSAEKKPYFRYGKLAQIGKISKLLLILILTYGTAIFIFIRTPGGRLNLLKFLCSWNAQHKNNRIVYWNTSTRKSWFWLFLSCLKKWVDMSWMGAYLCFSFFQLQKREIQDEVGVGVSVSGVTYEWGGLVIIYDEAWCWRVDGSKKGQF